MKKFTFAATAAVAAVMLFACGNGSPKGKPEERHRHC